MFCLFLLHVIFYFFEYFTFRLSSRLIFSITTLYKFLFELIIIFFNCKTWIVCRNCKRGSLQPWHNILQCEVLFLHVRWYNNTAQRIALQNLRSFKISVLSVRVFDLVLSGFRDLSVLLLCAWFFGTGTVSGSWTFDAWNFPRLYWLKFLVDFVLFFWCEMTLNYQHVQSLVLMSFNAEFGKGCYLGVLLSPKPQSSFAKVSVSFPSFV